MTKQDDLIGLYDGCEEHFNAKVDIFCNNAGINTAQGWRKCMDINIVSSHQPLFSSEFFFVDGGDGWDRAGLGEDGSGQGGQGWPHCEHGLLGRDRPWLAQRVIQLLCIQACCG